MTSSWHIRGMKRALVMEDPINDRCTVISRYYPERLGKKSFGTSAYRPLDLREDSKGLTTVNIGSNITHGKRAHNHRGGSTATDSC